MASVVVGVLLSITQYESIEDDIDILTMSVIESASEQRYVSRKEYRSGRMKSVVFMDDLQQLQVNSDKFYG